MKILPIVVLFCLSFTVNASELKSGIIVGITDGDTVKFLSTEREEIKVRLAEIDAPEKSQAFGQKSKQSLSDLCFNRKAELYIKGTDMYGRSLGYIRCDGVYANLQQVKNGMAWAYRKRKGDEYVPDSSNEVLMAESEAKQARIGLWSDPNPVVPGAYRKAQKEK